MQYAPIAYEDMSHLNAEWQEERPPVAGLGFLPTQIDDDLVRRPCPNGRCRPTNGLGEPVGYGQHSYVDVSFLNARLRPIMPKQVGLSPDGMGGGSLSGNSLGIDSGSFTKEQILLAQDQMNGALIQNGYAPIATDGKLGPATCGAIAWYQQNVNAEGGASFASVCATVKPTPPTKAGGGGTTVRSSTTPTPPGIRSPTTMSMGGGTNWMLVGGAVAAIAVGGAIIYRASKKR